VSRRTVSFALGVFAVLTAALACQSSGPAVVNGTGSTGQPENGPYPAPTPEWTTPRPSPAPTLPPPGILPTRTPK
jgi:hypothetical protein